MRSSIGPTQVEHRIAGAAEPQRDSVGPTPVLVLHFDRVDDGAGGLVVVRRFQPANHMHRLSTVLRARLVRAFNCVAIVDQQRVVIDILPIGIADITLVIPLVVNLAIDAAQIVNQHRLRCRVLGAAAEPAITLGIRSQKHKQACLHLDRRVGVCAS